MSGVGQVLDRLFVDPDRARGLARFNDWGLGGDPDLLLDRGELEPQIVQGHRLADGERDAVAHEGRET